MTLIFYSFLFCSALNFAVGSGAPESPKVVVVSYVARLEGGIATAPQLMTCAVVRWRVVSETK